MMQTSHYPGRLLEKSDALHQEDEQEMSLEGISSIKKLEGCMLSEHLQINTLLYICI